MNHRGILLVGILTAGCAVQPHSHTVYTQFSVSDAKNLSPDEAKALVVAQAARVEGSYNGGSGGFSHLYEKTVYEVFDVADGWIVYCHGGPNTDPRGGTVHVDRQWNPGPVRHGPPSENSD